MRDGLKLVPLALCAPLLLAASAGEERLAAPALPGFVVGYEAGNAQQSIREEIPAGETVEDWTRMVTTQRVAGGATRISPVELIGNVVRGFFAACPGGRTSEPVSTVRAGHAAAQFRADCPLLAQTGKPETFILLAVSGTADLHIKQVAFRRVPTADDVRWGEDFLAGVTLCGAGERAAACASS